MIIFYIIIISLSLVRISLIITVLYNGFQQFLLQFMCTYIQAINSCLQEIKDKQIEMNIYQIP